MTDISTPLWLQGGSYGADDDRALLRTMCSGQGIVLSTDLAVTQNGTPNMSVNVAAGRAFVQRTGFTDFYLTENDATVNLSISASNPTNPRWDLIVVRVQDAAYAGALNKATVEVVTGTPAASPVDPTVPSNCHVLARVVVAASATTVVTANITDLRSKYSSPYSAIICTSVTRPSAPWPGQQVWESDTLTLRVWNGTSWVRASGWESPYVIKSVAQSVNTNTTTFGDSELFVTLTAGRTYKVELELTAQGAQAGDIKIAWANSGTMSMGTGNRHCVGLAISDTDSTASVMRSTQASFATAVGYGTDGSISTFIRESFIVGVTVTGVLQVQWAQNTSSATNTTVNAGSWILATPLS